MTNVLDTDTQQAIVRALAPTTGAETSTPTFGPRSLHVLYGGAHLFKSDARVKLTGLVTKMWSELVPDQTALARVFDLERSDLARVYSHVTRGLDDAVHDLRIDFEDGYGPRSDDEEDAAATAAGRSFVEGMKSDTLPSRVGIRPKAFAGATLPRALRTLDHFFSSVKDAGGTFDAPFVVTLPKVSRPDEVRALAEALASVALAFGVPRSRFHIELMIETPRALFDESGRVSVLALVEAGEGLVESVHIGAYDLLSSIDVPARASTLTHPTLDTVRALLQLVLAETGVAVVDGATTLLPTGVHKALKGARLTPREESENRVAVTGALKLHAANVTRALDAGISRGWDLHPGQVLARRVALVAHLVREIDAVLVRLMGFLDAGAQAMRTGSVFDDAASALGLVNTLLLAARVGVVDDDTLRPLGLTTETLRTLAFKDIVQARANSQ